MKKYFLQILIVLLMLGIAWGLFLIGQTDERKTANFKPIEATIYQTQGDATNKNEINPNFYPIRNWEVKDLSIDAKSAIIISFKNEDEEGKIIFQKNADQVLPIASLTKLMTAIIAVENFNLDETVKVSKDSISAIGDKGGLIRGEELKINDLLHIMLIESSNDAATTIASDNSRIIPSEFINLMNSKVKELKLLNTNFVDSTGLNFKNQSSVSELVKITNYSLKFPIIWNILKMPTATVYSIDDKFVHSLINTNKLLEKFPLLRGGKTGYTVEADGCMITVSGIKNIESDYLITIILGSDQREIDMENLLNWAQEAYLWQ